MLQNTPPTPPGIEVRNTFEELGKEEPGTRTTPTRPGRTGNSPAPVPTRPRSTGTPQ